MVVLALLARRYIDMAETLCQKRALEAFNLDPEKWGGKILMMVIFLISLLGSLVSGRINDSAGCFSINSILYVDIESLVFFFPTAFDDSNERAE